MTRTIPKVRTRRMDKTPPPVFAALAADMSFDPGARVDYSFSDWGLDEKYPPTVGELLLPPKEEDIEQQQEEPEPDDAERGGGGVPGGPEDGDEMGGGGQDR